MPPKKKLYKSLKDCYCHRCGHEQPVEELYESYDPKSTDGYLPYCKTCCEELCAEFLKKTKSIEASIYFTCAKADVPFMRVVMESTQKYIDECVTKSTSYFKMYMAQLKRATGEKGIKGFKPKTFFDTDVALGDIKKLQASEQALLKEAEEFELVWGKQEIKDYQFLEYRWDVYTDGMALTPAQETLYRQLCLVELSKRKKEERNESTKDEQSQILSLMKVLKIDNFAENKDKTLVEQMIEADIAMMEKYEPAEYYEDKTKYADFLGIGKDYKSIMRSLKNLITGSREYPDINDETDNY